MKSTEGKNDDNKNDHPALSHSFKLIFHNFDAPSPGCTFLRPDSGGRRPIQTDSLMDDEWDGKAQPEESSYLEFSGGKKSTNETPAVML